MLCFPRGQGSVEPRPMKWVEILTLIGALRQEGWLTLRTSGAVPAPVRAAIDRSTRRSERRSRAPTRAGTGRQLDPCGNLATGEVTLDDFDNARLTREERRQRERQPTKEGHTMRNRIWTAVAAVAAAVAVTAAIHPSGVRAAEDPSPHPFKVGTCWDTSNVGADPWPVLEVSGTWVRRSDREWVNTAILPAGTAAVSCAK